MLLHSDPEFNRLLERSLSVTDVGAADATAIAGAGTRIPPDDVGSWERYWRHEGARCLDRADQRLAADDASGAGRSLLCASWAYGLAAHFYRSDPAAEMWQANRRSQVSAFRAAIPLLPNECEPIAVSGRMGPLHGYLLGQATDTCLLIPTGADSTAEDGYAHFASAAACAGVRSLVVDVPVGNDSDMIDTAMNWLGPRAPVVFVLGWGAMTLRTLVAVQHRDDLGGIVCCPDPADAASVGALIPTLSYPTVLLPPGSSVRSVFSWLPDQVISSSSRKTQAWSTSSTTTGE
ncbi:hypothetical protein [Williamsia soli]|uniref:hypothetical protein n=1 Tax=Williamsia soli TaxID=364929 RepID=UPI001A9DC4F7|nr:hypothetical protein [Williamsia soli]